VFMKIFRLLISILLIIFSLNLYSQCPSGEKINCTGDCGRFIDKNGDGYCDFGTVEMLQIQPTKEKLQTPAAIYDTNKAQDISSPKTKRKKHDLLTVGLTTVALYLISAQLCRRKKIKKATHRKIWNSILLISFLISGLLGLFLVVQLDHKVAVSLISSLLFWHVEIGIVMAIVALIHTFWHIDYFKRIIKGK